MQIYENYVKYNRIFCFFKFLVTRSYILKKIVLLQRIKKLTLTLKKKEVLFMIVVPVKDGETIDRALKKLKRKFEKTGVVKELRNRQKFTKPSVVKREQKLKAIYIQQMLNAQMD